MDGDGSLRVNLGYELDQLGRALGGEGEAARRRVEAWTRVLAAALSGTVRHGGRRPIDGVPVWVTPEVVTGGFATGRLAAAGPLLPHERAAGATGDGDEPDRRPANLAALTDEGRAALAARLADGLYAVDVPEAGALLTLVWLLERGETARADALLETLLPMFGRVRFTPRPSVTPSPIEPRLALAPAATVAAELRRLRAPPRYLAMQAAVRIWTPLADRAVALLLDTVPPGVEGPDFAREPSGALARGPSGHPIVVGGRPGQVFAEGWAERTRALLADQDQAVAEAGGDEASRTRRGAAPFRLALDTWLQRPGATMPGFGRLRWRLAAHVARHGRPGSPAHAARRAREEASVAAPAHARLAPALAVRLEAEPGSLDTPGEGGLRPLDAAEARACGVPEGCALPAALIRRARRAWEAPPERLIETGALGSAEQLATLAPELAIEPRAAGIEDPALARLDAAIYRAFRRRRSLLLLDLQRQVGLSELPWVAAVAPWVSTGSARAEARATLERLARLALEGFPGTLLPNRLVRELRSLAAAGELDLPIVSELAADIFTGDLSDTFLRAARVAGRWLHDSPYARYYGLPFERVLAWPEPAPSPGPAARASGELGALAYELADPHAAGASFVVRNGMALEQTQLLTTHGVIVLLDRLELVPRLDLPSLAAGCLERALRRLRAPGSWRDGRRRARDAAIAWRDLVLYLSIAAPEDRDRIRAATAARLRRAPRSIRDPLGQAWRGVEAACAGVRLDASGREPGGDGRRLLGWSATRPWVLGPAPADPR